MYPLRCLVANGANFTVVVSTRVGEKGALRGRGLGPWIEAAILRLEVGGIRVDCEGFGVVGISRYAEPDAEGTMAVWRTSQRLSAKVLSWVNRNKV